MKNERKKHNAFVIRNAIYASLTNFEFPCQLNGNRAPINR